MKRASAIILLFIISAACRQSNTLSKADLEAFDAGERYWKSILTKCGESYVAANTSSGAIIELRGVVAHGYNDQKDWKPNEADKLNGLEWVGKCAFSCTAFREYQAGKWSEWQSGVIFMLKYRLDFLPMKKVKGQWIVNEGNPIPLKQIPCEAVPKD